MQSKKKILLALSGGVDSSLAAALLIDEGYEVIPAFLKIWSDTKTVNGTCAWKDERRDALRVAAKLNIPLVTFDFEEEYRRDVASYLFSEYAAGRTPNPDVRCNSMIKFPLLWREAQKLGCEMIATGHHARVQKSGNQFALLAGRDANKDQSYFLHQLSQNDLSHTLFPIGEFTKAEVRTKARERGLPTADKRSTRGICFVGKVPIPTFLAQAIPQTPGPVRITSGKIVGTHSGVAAFTIGQRHGFGAGGGTPYFVISKNVATNTLVVGDEHDPALSRTAFTIHSTQWISGMEPEGNVSVRIRYRSALVSATLSKIEENRYHVSVPNPLRALAPGQFAVFYKDDVCLGGGVISD